MEQAEKCGELAKEVDGYNAAAYVNLGNCSLAKGEQQKAKQLYTLALDNDASCVEALYNLGKCIFTKCTLKGGLDYQRVVNYQVGLLTVVSSIWAGAERPRFVSVAFTLHQCL